ncbi:MAG: S8 family serine peptidase, partial [Deltaproteobacteria bacterium]
MSKLGAFSRIWLFVFVSLFVLPLFISASLAEEDFVQDELIVKIKSNANQSALQAEFSIFDAEVKETFDELDIVVLKLPTGDFIDLDQQLLEENPEIEYVEKNYIYNTSVTPNDPLFGLQDYLNVIDAPQAWNTHVGGSNAVIAVLDTGVESTHEDITGKLLQGCNVLGGFTDQNCSLDVSDNNGHGTGVAGTAALKTNNSIGAAGVCWNCLILPVKVLNDGGTGTLSDAIEGILFARAYALGNPGKRVVINMSFGRECNSTGITQAEQDVIDLAWNSGLLPVAAAGNDGNSLLQCPASANHVIAVSATTNSDQLAGFSSYGSFIDLAAPGVGIVNAFGTSDQPGSFYTSWSGTSFSSPIVSGIAGLVWSVDPSLTNAGVDQILRDTAENIGSSTFFGDGRVNAAFAVELASGGSPAPPTPAPTPTPPPGGSSTLSGFDPNQPGTVNTVTVTNAPRGARVNFVFSTRDGTTSIRSGACSG